MATTWMDEPQQVNHIAMRSKKTLELVLDEEPEDDFEAAPVANSSDKLVSTVSLTTGEYIEDLIREFFQVHGITDALHEFNNERPQLNRQKQAIEAKDRELALDTPRDEHLKSRLEALVKSWNASQHGIQLQVKKSKKERKPLKISSQQEIPEDALAFDFGVPGCTPKPRVQDLKSFGFDDLDEIVSPTEATAPPPPTLHLDKVKAKTHNKKVSIGTAGATPKKEYIFYRETPPSFVTESAEAAWEVMEKLSHDPAFEAVPEVQERLVELSSSEVGKYELGKRVQGLGANRDVCGIVVKKYGSKQCGMSGPGTIVIDTQVP
ncbi:unnamed protein product [Aphanomyces euteiches]|uniref:Uncharacterized protein n=1 Tax=Aphanomyces euteiches TaxID=100861 RepID=A0A6G0WK63_9STRA|nr:hypothetical protein Ae201684_014463 [Aphanomyces euteiches]KAH9158123.1 hypothetical protein AeRB84_000064 [Aphanomyces euteiches]